MHSKGKGLIALQDIKAHGGVVEELHSFLTYILERRKVSFMLQSLKLQKITPGTQSLDPIARTKYYCTLGITEPTKALFLSYMSHENK